MKILFLGKTPDATAYYRCLVPQKFLMRAGHQVKFDYLEPINSVPKSGIKPQDIEWADVVVVQRPLSEYALGCLQQIKQRMPDKILVGEYDDDYYSVPTWNPGYTFVKATENFWKQIPPLFDGIITSTQTLAEVYRSKVECPIAVIPNGFDFDMFDQLPPHPEAPLQAPKIGEAGKLNVVYNITTNQFNQLMEDKLVVCWAGSKFHYSDLDWLADGIKRVVNENEDIVFLFVGYTQGNIVKHIPINRLFVSGGKAPISAFYSFLNTVKIDVALAPLDPCEFNQSKSNLKILEAMAIKAFPICSQLDPYEDDLDPEAQEWEGEHYLPRHGTLVGYQPEDWAEGILKTAELLKDKSLASHMAQVNDTYNRSRHNAELRVPLYLNFFEQLLGKKG